MVVLCPDLGGKWIGLGFFVSDFLKRYRERGSIWREIRKKGQENQG